jgi:hypothetical protein
MRLIFSDDPKRMLTIQDVISHLVKTYALKAVISHLADEVLEESIEISKGDNESSAGNYYLVAENLRQIVEEMKM